MGCTSGPAKCSPPVGEIVPSAAPAPSLVTIENLSVASSLLPPIIDEDDSFNEIKDTSFSSGAEKTDLIHTIIG